MLQKYKSILKKEKIFQFFCKKKMNDQVQK